MSDRSRWVLGLAAALLGASVPAAAHHSFAAIFDSAKPVKVTGTVTRIEWMNPHTWIYLDVKNDKGAAEAWAFELGSPNRLMRFGWNQDSLATGTSVTITGSRARDGSLKAAADKVTVTTDRGTYTAEKLIVSAGAWLPELIGETYATPFNVLRQLLFWFDVKGPVTPFLPANCPIFIWELQGPQQAIYGFPAIDGAEGGVKVATQQYERTTTPETVNREVSDEEAAAMHAKYVAPYLPDLSSRCIKAVSCLYTATPDAEFVIDFHPESKNIIVASPCSGHGFKHSAAIGEALAELAEDGKSRFDLSAFRFARFMK